MNDLQKSIESIGANHRTAVEHVEIEQVQKDFTDKEFLKAVLINLASSVSTPPDIIGESEFSDVRENEAECLMVNADVQIEYSCSIGNDRQEQYIAVEDYYENGIKKQKKVNKTRTVTDWSPYSGTNKTNETVIVRNDGLWINEKDGYRNSSSYLFNVLSKCKKENITPADGFMKPTENALDNAEEEAIDKCFESVRFPGDRHEGETRNGKTKIKSINGILLPEYALDYEYKGKKYRSVSYACGKLETFTDYPDGDESLKAAVNISKNTRPITYVGVALIILAVVLMVISVLVPSMSSTWAYISFGIGLALIIFNVFVLRLIIHSHILKKQKSKKIEDLKIALQKYDLPYLSDEDLEKIKK